MTRHFCFRMNNSDRANYRYTRVVNGTPPEQTRPQTGIIAIGIFLIFGACMAALAGITLLWQGSLLDKAWNLNKAAYRQLSPIHQTAGVLFLILCATLVAASVGWFKRRLWGWGLAVGIIAAQVAGNFVNILRGDVLRGGTGIAIASALLGYMLRPKVRKVFQSRTNANHSVS